MPPKQRITKEMILQRAFEMFSERGMGVINARSVAKALNCSTQPIFSYFSGMEDLKSSLEQKAKDLFARALEGERREEMAPVVQYACDYVRFAAQHPHLYLHLSVLDDPYFPMENEEQLSLLISHQARYTDMAQEQAAQLCARLSVFALGLATARATGKMNCTQEQADEMIAQLYAKLIG